MKFNSITALAILIFSSALHAQGGGPLVPPGAPAPTMRTLLEIEPRIPLIPGTADSAAVMTSDSGYHFILKQPGSYHLIENCVAENNGDIGIFGGSTNRISNCAAFGNGGNGINGAAIEGCVASGNGDYGIFGVNVTNSIAVLNVGTGIFGSLVTGCTSQENGGQGLDGSTIRTSYAFGNFGTGIYGSDVSDCAATHCVIRDNFCDNNTGFGIHTTGIRNRIGGNQVTRNDVGIKVDAATSLIVRNTATGNTPNWQIAANNNVGTIIILANSPAINGNSGGSGVSTTDPWANFSY